jgi:uncharacterized Ntn-hydrolase superfamily protein
VASKFLAAGAYVPAAAAGAGALATQAYANLALRTEGLVLLREGLGAAELLDRFFADDPKRDERQAGVVDARGGAATFTGARACRTGWWLRRAGEHARRDRGGRGSPRRPGRPGAPAGPPLRPAAHRAVAGARAVPGSEPVDAKADVWLDEDGGCLLALSDVAVDLRSDDSPEPIGELERMLDLHDLYFGSTPEEELLPLDALAEELRPRLARAGYDSGDVARDLYDWMGRENFEERWHDGKVDPVVLEQLRESQ